METMEEIVQSISIENLEDKDICYRCIAAGVDFPDALHSRYEMLESPLTYDLVCLHCHDTEIFSGYRRMGKRQSEYVWSLIKEFERLKELRLRDYYDKAKNKTSK